jgi:proteasome lid subunit RPN8/RPN11
MRTAALAIGMALLITTSRSECVEIACDPVVVRQAWDLLKLARYGQSIQEHAAFITSGADGDHPFMIWPYGHQFCHATYSGPLPGNAVAIIHTHPNPLPYPSDDDMRLALRTGLPVYVVTRTMISRTTGRGFERLWSGDWNPELARGDVRSICRSSVSTAGGAMR